MRKALFGMMAALVTAGMLASVPAAAIDLQLGGYFNAGLAVTNQDQDPDLRDHTFQREAEIFFRGSSTLDNGLTVGVNVELEAENLDTGQIDETYLYFTGAFGEVRLGADDGAMEVMGIYPASAGHSLFGVVFTSYTAISDGGQVGEGAFGLGPDYDAEKIKWQSPRVGGVTVGVSYTPNAGQASGTTTPSVDFKNNDPGEQSQVLAAGANWRGDFAGGKVAVGAGYAQATLEAPDPAKGIDSDNTEWIAGASATMHGITVSGNYSVDDRGRSKEKDRTTIAVGATHGMGPWKYGITFANTERAEHDSSAVSLGVRYSVGGGVTVAGEVQFWDMDYVDDMKDNRATVGLIGTMVSF